MYAQEPDLQSARQKLAAEQYEAAEEELELILSEDSDNLEALKLLQEAQKQKNRIEARRVTERALLAIDSLDFDEALRLLKQAISLDPNNRQARELYISITEVHRIEEQSEEQTQMAASETPSAPIPSSVPREEGPASREEQIKRESGPEAQAEAERPAGEAETPPLVQPPGASKREGPELAALSLRLTPTFTLAGSNALDYVDSSTSMLGLRLDARYYPPFLKRRLGVSFDYSGNFLKTSGKENISFRLHRLNVSVRYRQPLLAESGSLLVAGARLSYHLFHLHNLLDQGVYNFKTLYGPSAGLFVADPVLYRFFKNSFFSNLGFEAAGDILYLPGKQDAASVVSFEFYFGAVYNLNRLSLRAGYRQYSVTQEEISEHYRDIEAGVGYTY